MHLEGIFLITIPVSDPRRELRTYKYTKGLSPISPLKNTTWPILNLRVVISAVGKDINKFKQVEALYRKQYADVENANDR